jgi:hypothetical protein
MKFIRTLSLLVAVVLSAALSTPSPLQSLALCSCPYCEIHDNNCIYQGKPIPCPEYYAWICIP